MDETLLNAEDYDLWIRMAQQSPFIFVPLIAQKYRQHSGSITKQNCPPREHTLQSFIKLYAAENSPQIKNLYRQRIARFHAENAEYHLANGQNTMALKCLISSVKMHPLRLQTQQRLMTTIIKIMVSRI